MIDTRTRANLTAGAHRQADAIDFAKLPLKDAIVWKQGTGARKMAVFADPNCGYCKRFERDLQTASRTSPSTPSCYPILGGDSPREVEEHLVRQGQRPRPGATGCSTASRRRKAWAQCDTARSSATPTLGRKYRINGTPAIIFEDGKRVPGAMNAEQLEKQLVASRSAKP